MDLEKRFCNIRSFLQQHQYLHELEVMERFPFPLQGPYHDWTEDILELSDEQIIALECFGDTSHLQSSDLIEFIQTAWQLAEIEEVKLTTEVIPQKLTRKLTPKKLHEISKIKGLLKEKDVDTIIDVGSGAGHLSSILVYDRSIKSICVDMNSQFQEQGKKKLERWNPELLEKLQFVPFELKDGRLLPFEYQLQKSLVLGLHSCGALSSYLIQNQVSNPEQALLNFGCCYHKLVDEYNLSQLAKSNPIQFTNHALTMAAKCHKIFDLKELHKRTSVKRFRYALHFYCQEVLNTSFATLGNAHPKDYLGKFSDYVHRYYDHQDQLEAMDLDEYFSSARTQLNIQIALKAGVIRSALGRLIELYLTLDRALFLKEHDIPVYVARVFDRTLSPRNIAIISNFH